MYRKASMFLLAAAAALAAVPASAVEAAATQKALTTAGAARRLQFRRDDLWGGGSGWDSGRRFRHGWSSRHVQRMATKKRNQARNRRAHRG